MIDLSKIVIKYLGKTEEKWGDIELHLKIKYVMFNALNHKISSQVCSGNAEVNTRKTAQQYSKQ